MSSSEPIGPAARAGMAVPVPPDPLRDLSALTRFDASRLSRVWPQPAGAAAAAVAPGPEAGLTTWIRWRSDELGEVLRHQLDAPLDAAVEARTADGPDGAPAASPPRTYGQLLSSPAPPLRLLQQVKQFAKPAMTHEDGDLPREVATVLYFGAIFAAAVRCGHRITGLTDRELRSAAGWALRRTWLPEPLVTLFQEGIDHLADPAAGGGVVADG